MLPGQPGRKSVRRRYISELLALPADLTRRIFYGSFYRGGKSEGLKTRNFVQTLPDLFGQGSFNLGRGFCSLGLGLFKRGHRVELVVWTLQHPCGLSLTALPLPCSEACLTGKPLNQSVARLSLAELREILNGKPKAYRKGSGKPLSFQASSVLIRLGHDLSGEFLLRPSHF